MKPSTTFITRARGGAMFPAFLLCFTLLSLIQGGPVLAQSGQKWATTGNSVSSGDFLGTTNNQPLLFKTNGIERGRFTNDGKLSILNKATFQNDVDVDFLLKAQQVKADTLVANNFARMKTILKVGIDGNALTFDGATHIISSGMGNIRLGSPSSYTADFSSSYTSRSLVDKGWVESRAYLTANQNITLSGDISGNGSTSIPATVAWQNGFPAFDARYLKLSGGTLTGPLLLNADPGNPLEAATKQYVDNSLAFAQGPWATNGNNISFPGNVGIGTATPVHKLEVAGAIQADTLLLSDNNFIGTVNNVPLNFRAGGIAVGRLEFDDVTGNMGQGMGLGNVFLGFRSGINNSTGKRNVAVGTHALMVNTSGRANTAVGASALESNTTGDFNAAIGEKTLSDNTSGIRNVALGNEALFSNTTGNENVAIGIGSLATNLSGSNNISIGYTAGFGNNSGDNNIAIGKSTLSSNTSGSNNTALGHAANVSTDGLTNATAIGANALVSASNSLILGSGANVGIGTSAPVEKLEVAGTIYSSTGGFKFPDGSTLTSASGSSLWSASGANIYFNTGNVGIGTNNPQAQLHLFSNTADNGCATVLRMQHVYTGLPDGCNAAHDFSWDIKASQANTFEIGVANAAHPVMSLFNTERVTIGTPAGAAGSAGKLQVVETAQNQPAIVGGDTTAGSIWLVPNLGAGGYNFLSQAGDAGIIFRNQNQNAGNAGLVIAPHNSSSAGMRIAPNGNVGVATGTPYKKLTVNADVSFANYNTSGGGNPADGFSGIEILGMDQVPTRRGMSVDPDPNGSFNFYINSNQANSAFNFKNGNTNSIVNLMAITTSGKVIIGNQTILSGPHADCLLSVNGKIVSKSTYVTLSNWADDVFNSDYKLLPLEEMENYYINNKHLPDYPSEKEIIDKGLDLGSIATLQQRSIEEIMLYLVEMKKEINALKEKKFVLENEIQKIIKSR